MIMQVALITGGGSGMGFAVAQKLVRENWLVAIVDLNEDDGLKAARDLGSNASFVKANVVKYNEQLEAFEKTFTKHGRLDFVFANAGIAGLPDFYDKAKTWPPQPPSLLVQHVNLTGVEYSAYLAMHYMRRNNEPGGVIIITASG
ncbi:putative 15-hydroxyprostaglandin dehydrogenase (nad(+)) protein [Phaeoacremonium minimum UCRPA7]|uniref:Putative 15-hydroxyprostaglandin dehydrogenase (Nad(+)) protein n=1 Tax=Phaeoacremonium minimum (strain UCR-PA7) TaxID=1286976 RepID=R8BHQ9_PHAM7|nr:putative 15-hydroxyprostaglandin dehydrogenase (nad(+)) protein [Phaeoacremonium minimum UCRPA7]EON98836.1 putative 15-hydroxyprostaglandin dehydrogenase (nad(+)) protein [Phaeoacremonium minimum UCRPA7]